MQTTMSTRMGVILGAIAVVSACAGCTSSPPANPTPTSTASSTVTPSPAPSEAGELWAQQFVSAGDEKVRWGDDIAPHIILTTYGSGSCPSAPVTLEVVDPETIAVTLAPPPLGACTADLRPTAFAAERPESLDLSSTITVLLEGQPYGTLPPLR
ncbi:hypothetical protein ACEXQE_14915 [Herbiconiux sp. P17]|uniref:hypothetical protein n=1 Tax=Herbiconiux wuyangfengii TaxID=3342794 RepID=UPI0035BA0B8D